MIRKLSIKKNLWALIVIFIILISYFFLQIFWEISRVFFSVLAILSVLFLLLGILLIINAKKQTDKLKISLLLTGFSAMAPLVFSLLHNIFYALAITFENLKLFFEILQVSSFFISVIIAPLTFVAGAIISLILLKTKK